jgi:hypothetical protein
MHSPEREVAGHALQNLLLPCCDLAHQAIHINNVCGLQHLLDAAALVIEVVAASC